jgi:hypothetical protein
MIITNATTNKIAIGCQHEFQLLAKPFSHATIDYKIDGGIDYKQKVMEAEQDVHHHRYMKPVIEVECLRKSKVKINPNAE